MESFSFGDSKEMSEQLLKLVIDGKKTGTSWAAIHGDCGTIVGKQMIITDYDKKPVILIETTSLERKKFNDVDKDFARTEGEGDLSLDYWRKEHKDYFTREGSYSNNMEIFCQRFKIVKLL